MSIATREPGTGGPQAALSPSFCAYRLVPVCARRDRAVASGRRSRRPAATDCKDRRRSVVTLWTAALSSFVKTRDLARIGTTLAVAAMVGCAVPVGGSNSGDGTSIEAAQSGLGLAPPPAATASVQVQGLVTGTDGVAIGGVQVLRLGLDPYLEAVLHGQTDAGGTFVIPGVAPDTREWFAFSQTGYWSLYWALDTTAEALQTLPTATLLRQDEAATLARSFGATLDATSSVVSVSLASLVAGQARPSPAGEVEVTFTPTVGVPVVYAAGQAFAFNVVAGSYFSMTVTRAGRACFPAGHPDLVQVDGSVRIATLTGFLTQAPAMTCP
jgi:hypothetical protein